MIQNRIAILEEFYKTEPNDPFNAYALALEYLNSNTSKAKALFEELLANHPTYVATYYHAAALFADLEENDPDQVIICIVGNFSADKEGIAIKVLEAMKNIPIRMISYGASEHNISLLVHSKYKNEALNVLNERLFLYEDAMKSIFSAQ